MRLVRWWWLGTPCRCRRGRPTTRVTLGMVLAVMMWCVHRCDRVDEEQRLINSFTYMKKADAVRWTTEETNQFYSVRRMLSIKR